MAAGKAETAPAQAPARPSISKKLFLPAAVGGIMLVEGLGIFMLVRMAVPGPRSAHAAGEALSPLQQIDAMDNEVAVTECDAINRASGQAVAVHIVLSALVSPEKAELVQKLVAKRRSTIQDRVQLVVRGADPKHLNDPGLETIRRQLKAELDNILGDDQLLRELLIPEILQTRSSL
jgi:flagellar basal body-associated protein FliL